MRYRHLLGGVVIACAACPAGTSTIIDTIGDWTGPVTSGWDHVSEDFEVPFADSVLSEFTFGVSGQPGVYSMSIYAWNTVDEHTVGDALFSTGDLAIPGTSVEFVTIDVNMALTPGDVYAAVFSFDDNPDGSLGRGVAFMTGDVYPGGDAHFTSGPIDMPWDGTGFELAFRAVFVPAPGAWIGLTLALALASGRRRRR